MNQWPNAILKEYPLQPGPDRMPGRPWYERAAVERDLGGARVIALDTDTWVRRDGILLQRLYKRNEADELDGSQPVGWVLVDPKGPVGQNMRGPHGKPAETAAGIAEFADLTRPFEHPGFRVGQVWARMFGPSAFSIHTIVGAHDGKFVLTGYSPENTPELQDWTAERLESLLQGALLVADPACPWLAPWSPVF